MSRRRVKTCLTAAALAAAMALAALAASGCGSAASAPAGLVISGQGLQTSKPPWAPEYKHLRERLKQIAIPPGGKETFHIHAMLHIYVNGLLVPVASHIGLDPAMHLESSLHTHDHTGVIHMEAPHRFRFTLGDFFAVWGVKLGPAQVGGLTGLGGDHLHFYINGKRLRDPAAYVMRNGDNIVIGYGPDSSFPHTPSTFILKEVERGVGGFGCSSTHRKGHRHSCVAGGSS
jgi:hypothetical protein